MKILIEKDRREVKIERTLSSAGEILQELKINPSTVLIVRSGEVLLPQDPVGEDDEIVLLSVVSGG